MNTKPLSRRTDPQSSHNAASAFAESNKLGDQEQVIFDCIKHNPGLTAKGIADELNGLYEVNDWTNVKVLRRTAKLRERGLITNGDKSAGELTWFPAVPAVPAAQTQQELF